MFTQKCMYYNYINDGQLVLACILDEFELHFSSLKYNDLIKIKQNYKHTSLTIFVLRNGIIIKYSF